ncbi:hypothetical protein GGI07_001608 [Coemansia sp. Benny D115]|nr:hypothetical protein GGI07_001608 [Coemansia sp. Benny D115]
MDAVQATKDQPHSGGGRYMALLRRTQTGVLFSDPIFVADDQSLPDLPEGLQYVVIHPSATIPSSDGSSEKAPTLKSLLPDAASLKPKQQPKQESKILLPVIEKYGPFSSFMPTRDSLLSEISAADYSALDIQSLAAQEKHSGEKTGHVNCADIADKELTEADMESAMELASKVLDSSSDEPAVLSSDLFKDIGISAADLGITPQELFQGVSSESETAETLLNTNDKLLAQLLEMQDKRALNGDFGAISDEEKALAMQLQINLTRAAAAQSPRSLRPSIDAIHNAAALLLSKDQGSYSGTLPYQRRFAFITNASTSTGVSAGATTAPMQRIHR